MKGTTRISRAGSSNSASPGFTLIELAVVVLILSIGLGLTLPMVKAGLMGNDFKAALRRLQGIVSEARYQAVMQRKPLTLTVSFPGRAEGRATYHVKPAGGEGETKSAGSRPLFRGNARLAALEKGNDPPRSSGEAGLRYLAQGLAEPAIFHLVADDKKYLVKQQAFSPRLLVQPENRDR